MRMLLLVAKLLVTSCCDLCDYPSVIHLENTPGGFGILVHELLKLIQKQYDLALFLSF